MSFRYIADTLFLRHEKFVTEAHSAKRKLSTMLYTYLVDKNFPTMISGLQAWYCFKMVTQNSVRMQGGNSICLVVNIDSCFEFEIFLLYLNA